ncbi:MAG: PP2C family protein-serine/threonine phosphatase [Calditrichaceae bacterium]|nr:PP2C family protein-serine/threonine phosphatase [Calditrichaceae bacterium]MBN2710135.1 PP2C family protein-serine/threonine phosphatase [Calditrichaceae bacterium]RQV93372.1 MAG: hypothetical protein EH224_12640 [Calditrichota bacterium]
MAGYWKKFKKDLRDIYEFYVDDETRGRVDSKGWFVRFIQRLYYILKNFLTKLNPFRKVVFILALIFLVSTNNNQGGNQQDLAGYLLLFLLLLELKDKLLVRRELEAGRAVQETLIPKTLPKIPGWDIWLYTSPANDVGGDLVDYLKINDHKHLFILADMAGKGLGAALLTSKLQATLRAIASADKSLEETAAKLNRIFYRDVMKKNFATLIIAELDNKTNQLNYINAGHLPPLKISGEKIAEQKKGDPAIGLSSETKYGLIKAPLNKNEIFLVYSDGITEARRQDGLFFGDKSLHDILHSHSSLSSAKLGDKIIKKVKEFLGESDPTDDISLLIIRRE